MPTATYKDDTSPATEPATSLSYLYHLEPEGVGTAEVESLTSYIARLAGAYHVPPKLLMREVILPWKEKKYGTAADNRYLDEIWKRSHSINGIGSLSLELVGTIQELTSLDHLNALTMLSWKNVIANKRLLRKSKAWCPRCYEEWRRSNRTVYDPLLWMVNGVDICLQHQQVLVTECAHCQAVVRPLTQVSKPGCCTNCQLWLGNSYPVGSNQSIEGRTQEYQKQQWRAEVVGALVATPPSLPQPPLKEHPIMMTQFCIEQYMGGNATALARLMGSNKLTLVAI
jgi:TniQ